MRCKQGIPFRMAQRVSGYQTNGLAELQAIETALKNIPQIVDVVIVSDSFTSIQMLQKTWESEPSSAQTRLTHKTTVLRIRQLLAARHTTGLTTTFVHIYSHEQKKLRDDPQYWGPKIALKKQELQATFPNAPPGQTLYNLCVSGNSSADAMAKRAL